MAENGQKRLNVRKWSKTVKNKTMENRRKQLKTVKNCKKWLKTVENGQQQSITVENSLNRLKRLKRLKRVESGGKWLKMVKKNGQ